MVSRLARLGLLYHSNADRMSKYQILQARDQYRMSPPPGAAGVHVREGRRREGRREGGREREKLAWRRERRKEGGRKGGRGRERNGKGSRSHIVFASSFTRERDL